MSRPRFPRLGMATLVLTMTLATPVPAMAVDFQAPVILPLGNTTNFAHDLKVADINHDGHLDIVVVDWVSNMLDVLLGQAGGGWEAVTRFPTAAAPYTLELVDVNGDTHLDAVTGNRSGASVSVFLGDGSGGFGPHTDFPAPAEVSAAHVGDVTGDGKPDIVAAADLRVCVFAGDGLGGFAAPTSTVMGSDFATSQVWGLALGDLDQDGDLDVVANHFGPLVRLQNDGAGSFTRTDFGSNIRARDLSIADVTGDGKADVLASSDAQSGAIVFRGDGAGGLTQLPTVPTGVSPWMHAIADIDGDGRLDAVLPNIGSATLSILLGASGSLGFHKDIPTQLNPISVDLADLNADGALDLIETGYEGAVRIRLQVVTGGVNPSTVVLSAPPAIIHGQSVQLTATVTPSSATGAVTFFEGTVNVGQAPVGAGGVAQLSKAGLSGGFHGFSAQYSGDDVLRPSASNTVQVEVTAAPTSTSIALSSNPSALGELLGVTATVVPSPPSPMDGIVIFRLDGTSWLSVGLDPVSGKAHVSSNSLSLGTHTLQASYEGTANHLSSFSEIIAVEIVGPEPRLVSVRDVPNDQGGRVTLKWDSPADVPGASRIKKYRIWRRAPAGFASSATAGEPAPHYVFMKAPGAAEADYWEAIADPPAEGLAHYAYTASTTQDSLPGSNPYTAFFVSAETYTTGVFFHSQVDSGYSVDNLSPPAPAPFSVVFEPSGNTLRWTPRRTPDLREYRIHRGGLIDFVPGPGNLLAVTTDSSFHDPSQGSFIYKLAAIDLHGNTSRYLTVSPDTPVGALASLAGLEVLQDRVRIRWYSSGGSGLPATLYRREATTEWQMLAQLYFDGLGYLEFDDVAVEFGRRYGYRLGIPDGDQELFTAEAWTTSPSAPALQLALVSANPSTTGRVTLALSLASEAPARLELVDVTGRRLATRNLSSLGPGRHTLTLDEAVGVRAGVYILRLSQGGASTTRRMVVSP